MKGSRALLGIACSAALMQLFVLPASASQPGNDVISGATPVAIGFTQELDTTQATTDAQDEALGRTCSGPAGPAGVTDASIWYVYKATTDGDVVVDVSPSDYSAGVYVASGAPGGLSAEACGPQSVAFSAAAGTTYYVVAFDDQGDGGGTGGHLRISFAVAPPGPKVDVSIDATGGFDAKSGSVTVSGTLTCANAESVQVLGTVNDPAGRRTITGFFRRDERECDGMPHRWTATVHAGNGKFTGGKATAIASSIACSRLRCAQGYADQAVRYRTGPR